MCSLFDDKGREVILQPIIDSFNSKKNALEQIKRFFDINLPEGLVKTTNNHNNRMLDVNSQEFRVTNRGLEFKNLKQGDCEFVDKSDGKIYFLLLLQAQRDTPSKHGAEDFYEPLKVTFSKHARSKFNLMFIRCFQKVHYP